MPTQPTVVFGVSGSISAYKSLDIIRTLRKKGVAIRPMLSLSGHQFVSPWTIEALSESSLINDTVFDGRIVHLEMIQDAALFVICPASANTIANVANGHCHDPLAAAYLAFDGPKMLVPAMHSDMYLNPITQNNILQCQQRGMMVVPPDHGELSCGDVGVGRLPHPNVISQLIECALQAPVSLQGKHLVITCGGTSEPMDPVRCITNLASGDSGHCLANMAALNGATVTLIRTVLKPVHPDVACIDVQSSAQMQDALMSFSQTCDALIMNAAVSDFTVEEQSTKCSRNDMQSLTLTPTPDILAEFNHVASDVYSVGFCVSDEHDLMSVGKQKQLAKKCHLMVANGVESFGASARSVVMIQDDQHEWLKNVTLPDLSYHILRNISLNIG